MGKVKEQLLNQYCAEESLNGSILHQEIMEPVQSIEVGDSVRVYDSSVLLTPKEGIVLYSKTIGDAILLSLELKDGSLLQVYEIQCVKLEKRLPRILWLNYDKATGEYLVSPRKVDESGEWFRVKETV